MPQTEGNLANVPAILSHQGAPREEKGGGGRGNGKVVMVVWQGEPRGWGVRSVLGVPLMPLVSPSWLLQN